MASTTQLKKSIENPTKTVYNMHTVINSLLLGPLAQLVRATGS